MQSTYPQDIPCRDQDPELFFPLGDKEDGPQVEEAKAVCRSCPIQEECLQDHIETAYGVVGGTTPGERRRILVRMGERPRGFSVNKVAA